MHARRFAAEPKPIRQDGILEATFFLSKNASY
jgi:hypothetical protein